MRKVLLGFMLLGFGISAGVADNNEQYDKIKAKIAEEVGQTPSSIKPSPIKDLLEVIVGSRIYYVSTDARYVISGDIFDFQTGTNITDTKRDGIRTTALEALGEKSMIVFSPKNPKHTITVFTDIDCGYCRKLHNEIAEFNKLGIKVRYLAYPRAGVGSESYNKAVSVWCADDRNKAMTTAKNGGAVPNKTCDNPVEKHFAFGQEMGINGTPAIMLENGKIHPGYVPAKQLAEALDKMKSASAEKNGKETKPKG